MKSIDTSHDMKNVICTIRVKFCFKKSRQHIYFWSVHISLQSTYLVAFVVGEYEAVEAKSKDGIIVRCYTPMGKTAQGQFALDTSVKSIDYYKDFFGVAYPLPKYDCIAIADFEMGWSLLIDVTMIFLFNVLFLFAVQWKIGVLSLLGKRVS